MQITQSVLYKRYTQGVHNQQKVDIEHGSRSYYIPSAGEESYFPQDVFVKSDYLQKIEGLGELIQGGFRDASSFVEMVNTLQGESILNSQDVIAAGYVARTSDEINFDSFNKILQNESLSMEMRGLVSQLINKLYNINYVHAGAMMAS